jgi:hypothetical protein
MTYCLKILCGVSIREYRVCWITIVRPTNTLGACNTATMAQLRTFLSEADGLVGFPIHLVLVTMILTSFCNEQVIPSILFVDVRTFWEVCAG